MGLKTVLVGAGSQGSEWYSELKQYHNDIHVAVVDKNEKTRESIHTGDPFYTSFAEAVEKEKPDFIINVTPPAVHNSVNALAFDKRIPVLCEKPIADTYENAKAIVERSLKERILFMIAENYRRFPFVRKVRRLIDENQIGTVVNIHVDFLKSFHAEGRFIETLPEPLLTDIAIHHLDMIRYFARSRGKNMFARTYNPAHSWFKGNANVDLLLEMENGVHVSFYGSIVASSRETSWCGDWIIEGTEGALMLVDNNVKLVKNGQASLVEDFVVVKPASCLDEFLLALKNKAEPETSGEDYLNTQALVHCAMESIRKNTPIKIADYA